MSEGLSSSGGEAGDPVGTERSRRTARRALPWLGVLYVVVVLFPVQFRETKALIVLGAFFLWGAALFIWWMRRWVRFTLLGLLAVAVVLVALPGRQPDPAGLRADYKTGLSTYSHTRYVWGGETVVGIDCSGLVREGLVWGELWNGVRTLNGTPIRNALSLWWHDASAQALGGGYLTASIGQSDSVNNVNPDTIALGDMAVTTDPAHVLVYIGDGTWMEADPGLGRVVKETVPSDNGWFQTPVVLVRWDVLADRNA